jgi:glycosyltransferase involved in cell wall biosynthesis
MENNKVCHLTTSHFATDNRIFNNECRALVREGYEVTLIAPNTDTRILDQVNIIGAKINVNPLSRVLFGAYTVYKKALQINADIYHLHDIDLFMYGLKLKAIGKKVIFDSHEDWLMYPYDINWIPTYFRKLVSELLQKLYERKLYIFDAVITVSPHIVAKMQKYSKNVYLITNYPNLETSGLAEFSKQDYLERTATLFYSGTVSNQETILKAISEISSIGYSVAGNIPKNYLPTLSKNTLWERVNYYGHLNQNQLSQAVNTATIGITLMPYHANVSYKVGSLGNNKVFDYLRYGIPLICTDYSIWKERIIDKYNCGICVNPHDVKEVRSAILYLMNNKDEAYTMGQNGLRAIKEEFNWQTQESTLLGIYEKLNC